MVWEMNGGGCECVCVVAVVLEGQYSDDDEAKIYVHGTEGGRSRREEEGIRAQEAEEESRGGHAHLRLESGLSVCV